jgi:hypothetical protein
LPVATTLSLDRVWINLLSTGEAVSAYSSDRSFAFETDGEVKTYAGGRRRSLTSEGVQTQFGFTLHDLTQTSLDTLVSWIGLPVQIRDKRGQLFNAVFHRVTPQEIRNSFTLWDAAIAARVVHVGDFTWPVDSGAYSDTY